MDFVSGVDRFGKGVGRPLSRTFLAGTPDDDGGGGVSPVAPSDATRRATWKNKTLTFEREHVATRIKFKTDTVRKTDRRSFTSNVQLKR